MSIRNGQYCPEVYIFSSTVFIPAFIALNVDNKEGDKDSHDEMKAENNDFIEKNNDNNNNYGEEGDVTCYGNDDDDNENAYDIIIGERGIILTM